MTELDRFTLDELDLEPLYHDFFRPRGIGWGMGTAIPIPTGENVCFIMTRRTERGPFERAVIQKLDDLRPHLAGSALMSARFWLQLLVVAVTTMRRVLARHPA